MMVTDNPLGIGGLLSDAFQVAQLMAKGYFSQMGLLAILPDASLADLEPAALEGFLKPPAGLQGGSVFGKLRDAEVFGDQRGTVVELTRKLGITEQTYYRWRPEYGGMRIDRARLSGLQEEKVRLRNLPDLRLDNVIQRMVADSEPIAGTQSLTFLRNLNSSNQTRRGQQQWF